MTGCFASLNMTLLDPIGRMRSLQDDEDANV